jgi:hypothetical protein
VVLRIKCDYFHKLIDLCNEEVFFEVGTDLLNNIGLKELMWCSCSGETFFLPENY